MLSLLARRARPCDVSAPETAKAPPTPRASGSGRSAAEDLEGARIWSAAAARRPACPAGEILVAQRLGAAAAGSSVRETCRDGLAEAERKRAHTGHPLEALTRLQRASNLAQPSRLRQGGELRPTLYGDNPWPHWSMSIRAPLSKPELRADGGEPELRRDVVELGEAPKRRWARAQRKFLLSKVGAKRQEPGRQVARLRQESRKESLSGTRTVRRKRSCVRPMG